jgi:hypothetical protein
MLHRIVVSLLAVVVLSAAPVAQTPAPVANITGAWTSSFETQIGQQDYTYDFVVKDKVLTGKLKSNLGGESEVRDGKVEGATVTFKETLTFMEMAIEIAYTGQIVSADEIKFTRTVGEFATEELVARRSK